MEISKTIDRLSGMLEVFYAEVSQADKEDLVEVTQHLLRAQHVVAQARARLIELNKEKR